MALARWIFGALCLFLMGGAAFVVAMDENRAAYTGTTAGSLVKLSNLSGHGSGVHIGHGYVLSAQHVVGNAKAMAYKRDDGKTGTATLLWANSDYDIALFMLDTHKGMAASNLECRTPLPGELVSLRGHPMDLENITTWGRVAGVEREMGHWKVSIPVDASIAGGMSGGGMFDADGDLIGINVGRLLQPIGFSATSTGISAIVPGTPICSLLARLQ